MEINYLNIRTHDGSKNAGFEELVCQLAHLEQPDNGKKFVRKDGSGGDAGVECYWILDDDSEVGWQVKYFPDGLNSSRWQQIDESFSTALEKHPNLTNYIICLPIDKSDSRKKGRSGKQVVSVEDEWLEHTKKWKKQAQSVGRNIEFTYWGNHEITSYLTTDNPLYSGRALYWFNEAFLGLDTFKNIAKRSQDSLGDRYTPEFHVELPIAKSFDGLLLNSSWWQLLEKKKTDLKNTGSNVTSILDNDCENLSLSKNELGSLKEHLNTIINKFNDGITYKDLQNRVVEINGSINQLDTVYSKIYQELYEKIDWSKRHDDFRSKLSSFSEQIDELKSFFSQKRFISSQTKSALLCGEAGIGKSHLLCDLSLNRLNQSLPTLFLLGSQYQGGKPSSLIKSSLDLENYRDAQVLGAIDAAGEAAGVRALIIIDAINEGSHRDDWYNQITGFLSDLSRFQNIALLISCRSTYLNYILPDSANEEKLVHIQHYGFSGYEHRAAEKFLSQQGISKPSAPILAPEFANPLFLKTCCRALKQTGQTSFPKGLSSITSLFDFYIESIEKIAARKKRFSAQEKIISSLLIDFASRLLQDNLEGIQINEARKLVNNYDPNPTVNDTLFNILIDEGVLSEDVSYRDNKRGLPVIRFTYERFSDYFIALELVITAGEVSKIFLDGSTIKKQLSDNTYHSTIGVLEALSIIIPEKFNTELVDILPDDVTIPKWQLHEVFQNSILWRSPDSFSDRTLELLNELEKNSYHFPALDILLKLSTEPDHPWNAKLIHKNLADKEVAVRDNFWSIHIANNDSSEPDDEYESTVRTIIEWSLFGEIETVEEERIRLCAITLLWFLTTPNRRIRDQSTKSLVRILSYYPKLVKDLLLDFIEINDYYLTERLLAASYGVVCNIDDKDIIREIAETTYTLIFKVDSPTPHILLRDYARGILEYALHLELLSTDINPKQFRPPYKSSEELENYSIDHIEELEDGEFPSLIKSSIMGFPGDFGNYTMGCVHNWSSTPLSYPRVETGFEIKKRFAEDSLKGDIKKEFLEKLEASRAHNVRTASEETIISRVILTEEYQQIAAEQRKKTEEFDNRIKAELNDEQKEYYRWISGASNDRPLAFSRKWAQRWVYKRALEYGWSEELFADFERLCSYGRGGGLGSAAMERIGKKYQWMAFHEFLARLSDNYHWINRGYIDVPDDDFYEGPWQIGKRDIDPTIWLREAGEYKTTHNQQCTWWQPYSFPFPNADDVASKEQFLWDNNILPDFSELLNIKRPSDNSNWFVLHGSWSEDGENSDKNTDSPTLSGWFRINSIFIHKSDYATLVKEIDELRLADPHVINIPSTDFEGFVGELPWHTASSHISGWRKQAAGFGNEVNTKHFIPFTKYYWEQGSGDHSLNSSLNFLMPAKELITDLKLKRVKSQWGAWTSEGNLAFLDPSLEEYGPSYALMKADVMNTWLEENDMEIIWLIGGEKQMFSSGYNKLNGRLTFNGVYKNDNNKPIGNISFEIEKA